MLSDIEITHQTKLEHISKVAAKLGLNEDELELYGKFKAKISPRLEIHLIKRSAWHFVSHLWGQFLV